MTIWGLAQSVEDLAVEQLIAKAGLEALDVAVLPRAAPLVLSGNAPQDEEVGQNVDHLDRLELAGETDRQAFMAELVERSSKPDTPTYVPRCKGSCRPPTQAISTAA